MTFDEAINSLDRDEAFRATVYAMNTLLLEKGVYTPEEFDRLFIEHAVNFKRNHPQAKGASRGIAGANL